MSDITEASLMVVGAPNRRGRPRVAERKVPVTTYLPPAYYDRITRAANARGEHVSEMLCTILVKALTPDR